MTAATIDRLDGVRPFVEVGVGTVYDDAGAGQWDIDVWDDAGATWAGDQPMWVDITCHVLDIATDAGRERAIDKWQIGTATVTCENVDGWADFPLSIGDLADNPDQFLLTVRPGRSIRVGVHVYGDDPVTLWAGYIDAANPTYDAVEGDRMTFECIDAKGDAGRADLAKLDVAAGASETVTARIGRILDAAAYPRYRRQLDSSGVALRATTLGTKAVDLMDRAADSAGGQVFGDLGADTRDPSVAFRGRDFLDYPGTAAFDGTIGNAGYPGSPAHYTEAPLVEDPAYSGLYDPAPVTVDEDPDGSGLYRVTDAAWPFLVEEPAGSGLYLIGDTYVAAVPPDTCPSSWALEFGRDDLTTQAVLARQGEPDRVYTDVQGRSLFGVEPYTRRDLETDVDADIDWYGERILAARSWRGMPRVAAVTVTAAADHPETITTLTAASPYRPARFVCQHFEPGVGVRGRRLIFDRVMMVVAVAHSITPDLWQARIGLDDAAPFLIGGAQPAMWDQTDVAEWDHATWADPT